MRGGGPAHSLPGMTTVRRAGALPALLLCFACEGPAIEASQSLVGARTLPTASALSKETVTVSRGSGGLGYGEHRLLYALGPDDRLVVTHFHQPRDAKVGEETFQLPSATADAARRMLWRLRPETLTGIEQDTRPEGCERQGPHDFGERWIVFMEEGPDPGVEDDAVGITELPYPSSCDTEAAAEARRLLDSVVAAFPRSRVAAAFPRDE